MNKKALIFAIFSAAALSAGVKMNVSVCNLGDLPPSIVARAEAQAAAVFSSIDIEVVWTECGSGPASQKAASERWFTVRLRSDAAPKMAGPSSLDAMGRAYVTDEYRGNLADAYYRTVKSAAVASDSDPGALLGCVIAHELGHLLLGPGHVPGGIMRAGWKSADLDAVRKRALKFNSAQSERIRTELSATVEADRVDQTPSR